MDVKSALALSATFGGNAPVLIRKGAIGEHSYRKTCLNRIPLV